MESIRRAKVFILFMLVFSVLLFRVSSVCAEGGVLEDLPIEVSADVSIYSKYIWRGFKLDDDPVMQPGVYISSRGFTASVWGSFDIDSDDDLNSDEMDYSIDYTHNFDNFSLSVGHTYYDFPAADATSKEFYLGVGLNTLLLPTFTWFHDYADEDSGGGDGDYAVLGISHSFELTDNPITLDLSSHVAYNRGLFINGEGGDVGLGVGLTIPLTDKISVSPNVNYSIPFGSLEDGDDGNQDGEFYGGATLAFGF